MELDTAVTSCDLEPRWRAAEDHREVMPSGDRALVETVPTRMKLWH
eukprot:SAG31_NODE_23544_length_502_cov_0.761787_1_plen_45_part_01